MMLGLFHRHVMSHTGMVLSCGNPQDSVHASKRCLRLRTAEAKASNSMRSNIGNMAYLDCARVKTQRRPLAFVALG